jgi:hypothetical protein
VAVVVQALDECRRTGFGRRGFPDQPISFKAELAWAGNVLVTVTDGESINRSAVAPADELYQVVAREGVQFFFVDLSAGHGGGDTRSLRSRWLY